MDRPSGSLMEAAQHLRSAQEVVVFTGAGISAESGVPTFRDEEGFWSRFSPEQFATWKGILATAARQPARLADFLWHVLSPIATARPNAAHCAVVELEKHVRVTVVTQNIDALHQEAGSTVVREIHGSLFDIVTRKGRFIQLLSRDDLLAIAARLDRARQKAWPLLSLLRAIRPLAGIGLHGLYHPHVILFSDDMAEPAWSLAREAVRKCDCMIQVGTSGSVWPAAMLPHAAKAAGASVIAIDPVQGGGDVWLKGAATSVLPLLLDAAFTD